MMLSKYQVPRVISAFIIPYIIFFGLYIQIAGEASPGGGFQAGIIFASMVILRSFFTKQNSLTHYCIMAGLGVFIYIAVGLVSMLLGGSYLDYSVLHSDPHIAQKIGIICVELGIGITVFSSMSLIYFLFTEE
jgi:multicomponent Na+:H+ antiporter subunit B